MKATATIIKGKDGSYDVTLDYNKNIPFGLLGQGTTVEAAIVDFRNSYAEMKDALKERGVAFDEELDFEFVYDTQSFLQSLSGTFTQAGLSKITGINQKQIGHYVQGVKSPRPATARRIQQSIVAYVTDLSHVRFV